MRLLFSETEAAKQNQKFPFHFLSAPPTPPTENLKKGRKILGFAPRELVKRGRGACLRRGFGRQASVIRQNPADFVRNTFELGPIHTARTISYLATRVPQYAGRTMGPCSQDKTTNWVVLSYASFLCLFVQCYQ